MTDTTESNASIGGESGEQDPQFWACTALGGLYGALAILIAGSIFMIQLAFVGELEDTITFSIYLLLAIGYVAGFGFGVGAGSGAIFYGVFWSLRRDANEEMTLKSLKRQARLISFCLQAALVLLFTLVALVMNVNSRTTLWALTLPSLLLVCAIHLWVPQKKTDRYVSPELRSNELPDWLKKSSEEPPAWLGKNESP